MKYIYFKSKSEIVSKIPLILEVISEAINVTKYENDDQSLTVHYNYSNLSVKEISNIIISELYEDILVYESLEYKTVEELIDSLKIVKDIFNKRYFKDNYINNFIILQNYKKNENLKKLVLSKYYNDTEMYLTIKTFLINNQNVSKSSDYLYLHRNTLSQRLSKFKEVTGFDVKNFIDGYLIYQLLEN